MGDVRDQIDSMPRSGEAPRRGRGPGRIRLASALMGLLGLMAACGTPTRPAPVLDGEPLDGNYRSANRGLDRAPAWSKEPHSWSRLDEIERWLAETPHARGFWRVEGALQLAEGQLRFANQDAAPGTRPEIVAYRANAALTGFRDVLSDADANADQRRRAEMGQRASMKSARPVQASASSPEVTGLVRRSQWSAIRAKPRQMRPASTRWSWITVHHSVYSSSSDSLSASIDSVRRIQREHIQGQAYADIGYHYLIDRAGRVIEGRELRWQGAHAGGNNNVGNVGICLLGNFEVEKPTAAAIQSLDRLVYELQSKLNIPRRNVRPHKAWKETACPGQHLMPWFTRR